MPRLRVDVAAEALDASPLTVFRGRCLNVSGRFECDACKQACPENIPDPDTEEIVSKEGATRCLRCGACAAACPTGVLELADGSYRRRLGQASRYAADHAANGEGRNLPPFTISCGEPSHEGEPGVWGACIAWVDGPALLSIAAAGFSDIRVAAGSYSVCGRDGSAVLRRIADDVQSVNAVLECVGSAARVGVVYDPAGTSSTMNGTGAASESLDRRSALRDVFRRGLHVVGRSIVTPTEDEPGGKGAGSPSQRRALAAEAIRALVASERREEPASMAPSQLPPTPPGALAHEGPKVDRAACIGCGACVTLCPTGALRSRDAEGEWRLSLDVTACVGCGRCAAGCSVDAMSLVDRGLGGLWREKRILLMKGVSWVCSTCDAHFGGPADRDLPEGSPVLCPLCERSSRRFSGFY